MYINIETLDKVSRHDLSAMHPDVSFPPEPCDETLVDFGLLRLEYDEYPGLEPGETVIEGGIRIEGEKAFQAWVVMPAQIVVTMRQCRLYLLQAGLLDQVEQIVAESNEETRIWWEYSQDVQMTHPVVQTLVERIGLEPEQVRQMFDDAAQL